MDCSPPGSSVHGIFQARIVEWVAISFSRGSSPSRDWTCVSCVLCVGRQILYHCATWEALFEWSGSRSVMSDSLRPLGLYSPWSSPGQNTGVGSLSLLQGIFPTQVQTQVSCIAGRFFTSWAIREAHTPFSNVKKSVFYCFLATSGYCLNTLPVCKGKKVVSHWYFNLHFFGAYSGVIFPCLLLLGYLLNNVLISVSNFPERLYFFFLPIC